MKVSVGGWLVNRNSPQSDADDIWKSFAYYTPLSSPRKWSTGQWPVVNGMTTPEYQMTQTGYRTIWESKVESSVALDQDLSFITKGLKFSGVFAFDTYNKNTIRRSKAQELWSAEYSRDANGNLVLKRVQNAAAMSQTKKWKEINVIICKLLWIIADCSLRNIALECLLWSISKRLLTSILMRVI